MCFGWDIWDFDMYHRLIQNHENIIRKFAMDKEFDIICNTLCFKLLPKNTILVLQREHAFM